MSSSTWLSIAFNSLSSYSSSTLLTTPESVLQTGLNNVTSSHVLHHLNRWSLNVWRRTVDPCALAEFRRVSTLETLISMGETVVSMINAVCSTMKQCHTLQWITVIGIMLFAEDPTALDMVDIDDHEMTQINTVVSFLFHHHSHPLDLAMSHFASSMSSPITSNSPKTNNISDKDLNDEQELNIHEKLNSLQSQVNDLSASVHRNEQVTNELLSSFHFWSMLLLDELRAYKSMAGHHERKREGEHENNLDVITAASKRVSDAKKTTMNGLAHVSESLRNINLRQVVETPQLDDTKTTTSSSSDFVSLSDLPLVTGSNQKSPPTPPANRHGLSTTNGKKARRIFRDGQWITQ